MKKLLATALIASISTATLAEEYQFIGNIGYTEFDIDGIDSEKQVNATYFFSAQKSLGPYDQFSYIDDTTNIQASYFKSGPANIKGIAGEYYFNRFAISAGYIDADVFGFDTSATIISASWFILENLKASLINNMPKDSDDVLSAALEYDHAINDSDYIGFTLEIEDDDENTKSITSKYFNALSDGKYIIAEAGWTDDDFDTEFKLSGTLYFSKATGVSLGVSNSDAADGRTLGIKHFFTPNFAMSLQYDQIEIGNSVDIDSYKLTAALQL